MSYGSEEDRRAGRIAIGIVLVLAVAAAGWWWWSQRGEPVEDAPPAVADAGTTPVIATPFEEEQPPAIQYPIETPPEEAPTEAAPQTDPDVAAQQAFGEVFGPTIADWLVNEQLARRLVATVDNLPRNARVEPLRPLRPPTGPFVVERETIDAAVGEERIVLSEENFDRYDAIVGMLAAVDAQQAMATYRSLYPQLQAAYEDLGFPGRYFNDRVVAVIDHLLATPTPEGPLLLEQPKVLYRFQDTRLEELSPGQKLLLRIGPEHARVVKQKLGELRALIAADAAGNEAQ